MNFWRLLFLQSNSNSIIYIWPKVLSRFNCQKTDQSIFIKFKVQTETFFRFLDMFFLAPTQSRCYFECYAGLLLLCNIFAVNLWRCGWATPVSWHIYFSLLLFPKSFFPFVWIERVWVKAKAKAKKNIYSGHKRVAIWHLAAFEKRFFFLLKCAWQQRRASWQGHIQKSKKQKQNVQNVYFFCLVETKAKNLIQSWSSLKIV